MFQSLTGTIHTRNEKRKLYDILPMFQSLTGTIHTGLNSLGPFCYVWFQSLTGTIHTVFRASYEAFHSFVSIPHRYDSHDYIF